jgi:hypothetical protein
MSLNVFLAAYTLHYPKGGGHFWPYLNWALSLRAVGCKVIWLETHKPNTSLEERDAHFQFLKAKLQRYGFEDVFAFLEGNENTDIMDRMPGSKDVLIDINFKIPASVVRQFRRSILIELDPGLNQVWLSKGPLHFVPHYFFFTIGETVGKPEALFPDAGIDWHYTRPPVYLPFWTAEQPASEAPFTTVTQWWGGVMNLGGKKIYNRKRAGFLPYLELPRHTSQILELAINLTKKPFDERERQFWVDHGWRIKRSSEVASSPEGYQNYLRNSLGEFSCAKPSYVHLQTAWISDRTICYLASGRPAIVEHTGPSSFLPDAQGIFRFRNLSEAVDAIERVAADYEQQSKRARELAEDAFDGEKIVKNILEIVL